MASMKRAAMAAPKYIAIQQMARNGGKYWKRKTGDDGTDEPTWEEHNLCEA